MKKKIHNDFFYLFTQKESKVLLGKYSFNLIFLIFILFLTYFAIGFGKGTLAYLKLKMEDPFIQLVEVRTSFDKLDKIESIIKDIDTDPIKEIYGFTDIDAYTSFSMDFYQKTNRKNNEVSFYGRTIDSDNYLLEQILSEENKVKGRKYIMPDDHAVIVSRSIIKELGYSLDSIPYFLYYSYFYNDSSISVPLPVLAVVKDLPGEYDFLITKYLKDKIDSGDYPLNNTSESQARSFLTFIPDEESCDEFIDFLEQNEETLNSRVIDKYVNKQSYENGFIVNCILQEDIPKDFVADFFEKHISTFNKYNATRIYNFDATDFSHKIRIIDHFSVFFNDLSKTGEFREFMQKKHKVMVDLNQVMAKENYAFIQNISNATSWFLIFLSIISICLFISNLLKNHIEKIKINLGTFKAFGLNNISLIITYSFIITGLIIASQIVGAIISQVIGNSLSTLIIEASGIEPELGISYFNILNPFSLKVSLFILFISFIVILIILMQNLTETPGNLIYNRSSKK